MLVFLLTNNNKIEIIKDDYVTLEINTIVRTNFLLRWGFDFRFRQDIFQQTLNAILTVFKTKCILLSVKCSMSDI